MFSNIGTPIVPHYPINDGDVFLIKYIGVKFARSSGMLAVLREKSTRFLRSVTYLCILCKFATCVIHNPSDEVDK